MNCDAVLVREPKKESRIIGDWVMNRAVLFRNFNSLEPFWKSLDYVLLKKSFSRDPTMVTLHCDRTFAQMRQHHRGDHFIVRGKLTFSYPVSGKQHLVWMRDHGYPQITQITQIFQRRYAQFS